MSIISCLVWLYCWRNIYICRYCYVAARLSLRTLLSHMTVATQCHAHAFRDAEFVTPKATGVLLWTANRYILQDQPIAVSHCHNSILPQLNYAVIVWVCLSTCRCAPDTIVVRSTASHPWSLSMPMLLNSTADMLDHACLGMHACRHMNQEPVSVWFGARASWYRGAS